MPPEDMNTGTRDTEDMPEESRMNDMEEGEEEVSTMVMEAVEACFAEGGEAYGSGKNEAIDAVIAKLEGMKDTADLGGLGDEEAFELPEEEESALS